MSLRKVLIVDDEERICRGLETIIEWNEYGYEVCATAENGGSGLAKAREHKPDLIITDVRMPGIDGLQMIEALQAEGFECSYIILSGFENFQYARRAIDLKVETYLLKPVDEYELIAKLKTLTGGEAKSDNFGDHAEIVAKIMEYTENNYNRDLKLKSFAKTYHYSTPYLGRIFKKITGDSFPAFVEKVRMEKAKLLLKKGNKVYVVAKMTGYGNVDYFTDKFKSHTGMTPSEYKNV